MTNTIIKDEKDVLKLKIGTIINQKTINDQKTKKTQNTKGTLKKQKMEG